MRVCALSVITLCCALVCWWLYTEHTHTLTHTYTTLAQTSRTVLHKPGCVHVCARVYVCVCVMAVMRRIWIMLSKLFQPKCVYVCVCVCAYICDRVRICATVCVCVCVACLYDLFF